MICKYCGDEREGVEGWHTCAQARDARLKIEKSIEGIMRVANGTADRVPKTSDQMKVIADRRRNMATSIKLGRGRVKPDYEEHYDGRET